MKKILVALVMALSSLFAGQAVAGPCVSGTAASYAALGSSGCTIGMLTFANFSLLGRPNGASGFATLLINPFSMGSQVGFDFITNQTATTNQFFDDLISYRVVGGGAAVNNASISFLGSSSVNDASVTTVQNLCINGLFGDLANIAGCTGTPLSQIIVDTFGGADPPATLTFMPASSLAVVTDLGVDGGTDASAGFLLGATNRFNVVRVAAIPEPASILLLSIGLFGFVATRSLRRRNA